MRSFVLLLVSLFLVAAPVHADEKKEVPEYLQKKYDRRTEDMKAFDKNKDGLLSPEKLLLHQY